MTEWVLENGKKLNPKQKWRKILFNFHLYPYFRHLKSFFDKNITLFLSGKVCIFICYVLVVAFTGNINDVRLNLFPSLFTLDHHNLRNVLKHPYPIRQTFYYQLHLVWLIKTKKQGKLSSCYQLFTNVLSLKIIVI